MNFIVDNLSKLARHFGKCSRHRRAAFRILWGVGLASCVWELSATEFYVAPNGSATNNGSLERPWDLRTALKQPTNVFAGDTIWLRGGVHRRNNAPTKFNSILRGEFFNPIIVRQYPGERAIVDGNISQFEGGWVVFWGFEIMNSHPNRLTQESGSFPTNFTVVTGTQTNDLCVSGLDVRAENVKVINVVVHDSIGGGFGVNADATNSELNGVISFYNGWQGCDRAHGHGYYGQNRDPSYAFVFNGLFFDNYALGIQATSNEGLVDNFFFQGNGVFANGSVARKHQGNFLVGPAAGQAMNPNLHYNFVYDPHVNSAEVNVGYLGGATNPTMSGNYFQTPVTFSSSNQNLVAYGNAFLGGTDGLDATNYSDNTFSTIRPETNFVQVLPNVWDPDLTQIIVYNWEGLSNVEVEVGRLLLPPVEFEVRNVQDLFGAPVLTGTYSNQLLQLPMTGLRVAKPIGTNAPPSTAPEFNVFLLRAHSTPLVEVVTNTAPSISPIANQLTERDTPTAAIPFSISDAELPAEFLTLSVSSSNPGLVSYPNIRFTGNGMNRFVTIVPMSGQSGVTTITIAVSDGFLSASNVFDVQVSATNNLPEAFPQPTSATLTIQADNTAMLHLNGPPETEYQVQASTNLLRWRPIGTILTDCVGLGFLQDRVASNYPTRFYRFAPTQGEGENDE